MNSTEEVKLELGQQNAQEQLLQGVTTATSSDSDCQPSTSRLQQQQPPSPPQHQHQASGDESQQAMDEVRSSAPPNRLPIADRMPAIDHWTLNPDYLPRAFIDENGEKHEKQPHIIPRERGSITALIDDLMSTQPIDNMPIRPQQTTRIRPLRTYTGRSSIHQPNILPQYRRRTPAQSQQFHSSQMLSQTQQVQIQQPQQDALQQPCRINQTQTAQQIQARLSGYLGSSYDLYIAGDIRAQMSDPTRQVGYVAVCRGPAHATPRPVLLVRRQVPTILQSRAPRSICIQHEIHEQQQAQQLQNEQQLQGMIDQSQRPVFSHSQACHQRNQLVETPISSQQYHSAGYLADNQPVQQKQAEISQLSNQMPHLINAIQQSSPITQPTPMERHEETLNSSPAFQQEEPVIDQQNPPVIAQYAPTPVNAIEVEQVVPCPPSPSPPPEPAPSEQPRLVMQRREILNRLEQCIKGRQAPHEQQLLETSHRQSSEQVPVDIFRTQTQQSTSNPSKSSTPLSSEVEQPGVPEAPIQNNPANEVITNDPKATMAESSEEMEKQRESIAVSQPSYEKRSGVSQRMDLSDRETIQNRQESSIELQPSTSSSAGAATLADKVSTSQTRRKFKKSLFQKDKKKNMHHKRIKTRNKTPPPPSPVIDATMETIAQEKGKKEPLSEAVIKANTTDLGLPIDIATNFSSWFYGDYKKPRETGESQRMIEDYLSRITNHECDPDCRFIFLTENLESFQPREKKEEDMKPVRLIKYNSIDVKVTTPPKKTTRTTRGCPDKFKQRAEPKKTLTLMVKTVRQLVDRRPMIRRKLRNAKLAQERADRGEMVTSNRLIDPEEECDTNDEEDEAVDPE